MLLRMVSKNGNPKRKVQSDLRGFIATETGGHTSDHSSDEHSLAPVNICVFVKGSITRQTYKDWEAGVKLQITNRNITLTSKFQQQNDFIIAGANCKKESFLNWTKTEEVTEDMNILKSDWIVESLKAETLVDPQPHRHELCVNKEVVLNEVALKEKHAKYDKHTTFKPRKVATADEIETANAEDGQQQQPPAKKKQRRSKKSTTPGTGITTEEPTVNVNKHITDILESLQKAYESSGDRWRSVTYKRAAATIKHQPLITDVSQLDGIPGIGKSIKEKVGEIIATGNLGKLEEFKGDRKLNIIQEFTNIFGVGDKTAEILYNKGYRSIEDLRGRGTAELTAAQRIGLTRYEDLLEKIPREETAEIHKVIDERVQQIAPGAESRAVGSYRRGKPSSGDVDIIISPAPGQEHLDEIFILELVYHLEREGYLTDHLSVPRGYYDYVDAKKSQKIKGFMGQKGQNKQAIETETITDGTVADGVEEGAAADPSAITTGSSKDTHDVESKAATVAATTTATDTSTDKRRSSGTYTDRGGYMGVFRLAHKPGSKHRRLDIKVYPRSQYAFALLYFTGPDHFERSLRFHAKQLGYKLSDKGLFPAERNSFLKTIVETGPSLRCETERDIFTALGIEYKEPWERNIFENLSVRLPVKGREVATSSADSGDSGDDSSDDNDDDDDSDSSSSSNNSSSRNESSDSGEKKNARRTTGNGGS